MISFEAQAQHLLNIMTSEFGDHDTKSSWIRGALEEAYKRGSFDRELEMNDYLSKQKVIPLNKRGTLINIIENVIVKLSDFSDSEKIESVRLDLKLLTDVLRE